METGHLATHDHETNKPPAGRLADATAASFPLSFAQRRFWFFEEMEPGNPAHHLADLMRIRGPLDATALESALTDIVRRHAVLRSVFHRAGAGPMQRASDRWTFELSRADLSAADEPQRERELERFVRAVCAKRFDLSGDVLLRACLVRLARDEHALLLVMHRIATDDTSMALVRQELETLYEARLRQSVPATPEPSARHAEFAASQQTRFQGATLRHLLGFWREHLAGAPPVLALPADHPRAPGKRFRGAVASAVLPTDLLAKIDAFSREHRTTRFLTLLAAFKALLVRYTGQNDFVVGTPLCGRTGREMERVIGNFTNMLILRTRFDGDPTFADLLARVAETTVRAGAYRELPFEKLIEELHPKHALGPEPLCQVMFAIKESPSPVRLADATAEVAAVLAASSRNDLFLWATEAEAGMRVVAEYNADLFEPATIEHLLGHFRILLESAVSAPAQRVSRLTLLTEEERARILGEWNRTETPYPKNKCIHDLIAEQVVRTPDATALVFNDTELSYAELDRRARQVAGELRARGVRPGTLVAICMERSLEMIVGLLAILKAGGAYVPLDPAFPRERLALMLEDTEAPVLITQRPLAMLFPSHPSILFLDRELATPNEPLPEAVAEIAADPDNLAYVLYTSGSTGRPKGVMITHRNAVNFFAGMDRAIGREPGVWMAVTSISFDISVLEIFWTLSRGFKVLVLSDQAGMKAGNGAPPQPGTRSLDEQLARHAVTHLQCTPSFARLLTRMPETLAVLRPLRRFLIGGEPLPPDLAAELVGSIDGRLINMYGPTETTVWSTTHVVERGDTGPIPIGRPIANTRTYILDRNLQPVPVGVPGELYIGGDGVAPGYLRRPELTAERFVADPFSTDGSRLYRTGDLARYRADGVIEFLGRVDFQVKIRGYRIELGEIEAMLAQHGHVQECVLAVREDDPANPRLVAYVVSRAGASEDAAALRNHLREKLPAHMVPELFVFMERFPLTPNGKIDRKALPAPVRSVVADTTSAPRTTAPLTGLARRIADVWEQVLGIGNPSADANFFDLGGTSLQVVEVQTRLRAALGIDVPVIKLFQYPTIRSLADALGAKEPEQRPAPVINPFQERARRRHQALQSARRLHAEVKA